MKIMFVLPGIAPTLEKVEVPVSSIPPAPTGKISLEGSDSNIGDLLYEGSVFIDGMPVCDNSWDDKEAMVVCRCFELLVVCDKKYGFVHQDLWLQ